MTFDNNDDDEREDFFEETPPVKPKEPKQPPIPPEDPRYWEKEEDEWEHLRVGSSRRRIYVIAAAGVAVVAAVWILCVWMFGTVAEEQVSYGYVDDVELRGSVIKTYEGRLIPYKAIHDTTRLYEEDFILSLPDREGKILQTFRDSGKPVKITYRTYRSVMPWRGESRRVAVKIDTVSPRTILPAEFDANPRR